MPRSISASFRRQIEAVHADDVIVTFATIYHNDLLVPIRVNTDIVDYWFDGFTFTGAAFGISMFMSDDDRPPRAKIIVPNVSRKIGEGVLALNNPARLDLQTLVKSDFNDDTPRRPLGVPIVEYAALFLLLRNVTCNAGTLQGDIGSFDLSTEPYPAIRSTPDNLPALAR